MFSCKLLGSRTNRSTMVTVSEDRTGSINDENDGFGGSNVPYSSGKGKRR